MTQHLGGPPQAWVGSQSHGPEADHGAVLGRALGREMISLTVALRYLAAKRIEAPPPFPGRRASAG